MLKNLKKKINKYMFEIEKSLYDKGFKKLVGIDEAGRGPLAGPVVSAAVIFPQNIDIFIEKDSKKLSPKKRETLFEEIRKKAVSIGIGVVDSEEIDRINIYNATKLAMKRALFSLKSDFDYIITDYIKFDPYPHISIKKADEKSISVAAASIIAKVYRDKIMEHFSKIYPHSFERHKGYPTKLHIQEIKEYGITPIHRKSFRLNYE
nr:ribonuclease HII [Hydrogenothermus marinus]